MNFEPQHVRKISIFHERGVQNYRGSFVVICCVLTGTNPPCGRNAREKIGSASENIPDQRENNPDSGENNPDSGENNPDSRENNPDSRENNPDKRLG